MAGQSRSEGNALQHEADSTPIAVHIPGASTLIQHLRAQTSDVQLEQINGNAYLRWRDSGRRIGEPVGRVLWRFLELADADDQEVIDFARRYGPLGLGKYEKAEDGYLTQEPVESWRRLASGLKALTSIAVGLRVAEETEETIGLDEWVRASGALNVLSAPEPTAEGHPEHSGLAFKRFALSLSLFDGLGNDPVEEADILGWLTNDLLAESNLKPAVMIHSSSGSLQLGVSLTAPHAPGEVGAAPIQVVESLKDIVLLATVDAMSSDYTERCSICKSPYTRGDRRSRYDRQHFCSPDCRREAKLRQKRISSKKNYARRKDAASKASR